MAYNCAPVRRDDPIIVGGCYRSGTTLVRRLLNAHPRIFCGPEVKFFRDFYGHYADDRYAHLRFFSTARFLADEDERLDLFGHAYVRMLERAAARAGKARWADKNPDHVLYLSAWQRLLGDGWRLVHVVRDPLQTVASLKEANFALSVPATLDGWIETYVRFTSAGLDWGVGHPERYRCVHYDHLVTEPARTLADLMRSLGEQDVPEQLALDRSPLGDGLADPKSRHTAAVHRDSLGRWTRVLDARETAIIRARTAAVWDRACAAASPMSAPADAHVR
jgi:hypothetical protein